MCIRGETFLYFIIIENYETNRIEGEQLRFIHIHTHTQRKTLLWRPEERINFALNTILIN